MDASKYGDSTSLDSNIELPRPSYTMSNWARQKPVKKSSRVSGGISGSKLEEPTPPLPPPPPESVSRGTSSVSSGVTPSADLTDLGEDRLIQDFGPHGRIRSPGRKSVTKHSARCSATIFDDKETSNDISRASSSGRAEQARSHASHTMTDASTTGGGGGSGGGGRQFSIVSRSDSNNSCSSFAASDLVDQEVIDERGLLRRRMVYDPTEIARALHLPAARSSIYSKSKSPSSAGADGASAHGGGRSSRTRQARGASLDEQAEIILDRLHSILEMSLDSTRPGRESLLICKAVTDAFLVNAPQLQRAMGRDDLLQTLRSAWRHAVEHWNGSLDEPHSAADLHLTASWFQAWWAADDTVGEGESTVNLYGLHRMLPGDWDWVLDHLEIAGAAEGIHLDEEVKLAAAEDRRMKLKPESWGMEDIKSALLGVSDEEWFQEGGCMLDLRLTGPTRASTFRRVFANVPGAIYGCLKDQAGVESTPPTFRMYTTGDIFEALGEEVMLRSRDGGGEPPREREEEYSRANHAPSHATTDDSQENERARDSPRRRRQVVSLVELQVVWVGGHTHLLGWLDFIQV